MIISVDYNDAGAVDPSATDFFEQQSDIDNFLAAAGATNFKHIQPVWDAIPPILKHTITFNLAAGVHYPLVATFVPFQGQSFGWVLDGKKAFGSSAGVSFVGSSSFVDDVAPQTITGVQLASGDPWVDVSGTPFPADRSLRGKFAVFSTGQKNLIHDHTTSRLFLVEPLLPDPTGGTVSVAHPSTILRNTDPTNTIVVGDGGSIWWDVPGNFFDFNALYGSGNGTFENLRIDAFGSNSNGFITVNGNILLMRCLFDIEAQRLLGVTNAGLAILQASNDFCVLYLTGWYADPANHAGANGFLQNHEGLLDFIASVAIGAVTNMISASIGQVQLAGSVVGGINGTTSVVNMSQATDSRLASFAARGSFVTSGEITSKIVDGAGSGLELNSGLMIGPSQQLTFENITGPSVVKVSGGSRLLIGDSTIGLVDGGGNTGVGIEVVADVGNQVDLNAATNVTGTLGDLKIDGVIGPYSDIQVGVPLSTINFNRISRK